MTYAFNDLTGHNCLSYRFVRQMLSLSHLGWNSKGNSICLHISEPGRAGMAGNVLNKSYTLYKIYLKAVGINVLSLKSNPWLL